MPSPTHSMAMLGAACILGGCLFRYFHGSWGQVGDPLDFIYLGVGLLYVTRFMRVVEKDRKVLLTEISTWEGLSNRWEKIAHEAQSMADEAIALSKEQTPAKAAPPEPKQLSEVN